MPQKYDLTRTVARHPLAYGAANAFVFSVLQILVVFRAGSLAGRLGLGVPIGVVWGITQFMLASYWRARLGD